MKKSAYLLLSILLVSAFSATAQPWQPAGDHIRTPWADQVDPAAPLPEYPRPLMQRADWMNLNGLWDYAVREAGGKFDSADGKILVPFCIESSLSGVGRSVDASQELWYRRNFTVPKTWKGKRVLLHFGAGDWKAGTHTGGYTPFSFDITDALKPGENILTVRVWDGTDTGFQPRGKQVSKPGGIWYTAVTGIWQTVWMEPVPEQHIANLRITPDLDASCFRVKAEGASRGIVECRLTAQGRTIATARALAGTEAEIPVSDAHLWSPDDPFLYDLVLTVERGGKAIDKVESYFAMRKVSCEGNRVLLNDKPVFLRFVLDQGFYPDGVWTASPS